MKIVFFGTPDYVVPIVDSLYKKYKDNRGNSAIVAVVTQPPLPSGRNKELAYSAIDTWAHKHNIPIFFDSLELLTSGLEWEVGVLAAYGAIIPQDVIDAFPEGILNIHPSILPEFRGASPIQATLAANKTPGVTIMKLDNLMDHGEIVTQFKDEQLETDNSITLRERLFIRASEVLINLIPAYLSKKVTLKNQDHSKATYTKLIKKEDGFVPFDTFKKACLGESFEIDIKFIYKKDKEGTKQTIYKVLNSKELLHLLKAFMPWPGLWTQVQIGKEKDEMKTMRLKILEAHIEEQNTKSYTFVPDVVQLEGKNKVSWQLFKNAYKESLVGF